MEGISMQKSDQNSASRYNRKVDVDGRQPTLSLVGFAGYVALATEMGGVFVWIVIYGAFGG